MSVRVNLLPEARLTTLKNKSKRHTYTTTAILSGAIVLSIIIVLLLLLGYLYATYQTSSDTLKNLNNEISKDKKLEEDASTLQDNLASFYSLNKNRTYASRIFTNLFNAVPPNVKISSFQISGDNKVAITAKTDSFADVAKTAESLTQYNINYKPQADLERKPVFSNVNIDSVSKGEAGSETTFAMSFKVDNELLKKQKGVQQ